MKGLGAAGAVGAEDGADTTGAGVSVANGKAVRIARPTVLTAGLGAGAVAGNEEAGSVPSFSSVRETTSGATGASAILAGASAGNAAGNSTGKIGATGASGFAGDGGLSSAG